MNNSSCANSKSKGKSRNSLFLSHESTYKGKNPRYSVFDPNVVKVTGSTHLKIDNNSPEKSKLKSLDLHNTKLGTSTNSKILDMDDSANNDSFYNQMITKYCTPKPESLPKKKRFISKDHSILNQTPTENVANIGNMAFKIMSVSHFEINSRPKLLQVQKEISSFELIPSSFHSLHSKNEPLTEFKLPSQLSSISITPRKIDSSNQNIFRRSKVNFKCDDKPNKSDKLHELKHKPTEIQLNASRVYQSCDEGTKKDKDHSMLLNTNLPIETCKSKRNKSTKGKMKLWLCF